MDPRITYAELEVDYADDADLLEGLERSKTALQSHFTRFYARSEPPTPAAALSSTPSSAADMLPILSRSSDTPVFDFTARFRKLSRQPSSLNELEEYLRLPPQEFSSCNPMRWWYAQRERFPNLYKLARDVLAIPGILIFDSRCTDLLNNSFMLGSAVAVERLFSGGRDTIALRRASLHPDTIRILMILKQHIRVRESQKAK